MSHPVAPSSPVAPLWDRSVLLVLLVTLLVWCGRSAHIALHHSPCIDAHYHLVRGYAGLTHNKYDLILSRNDGSFGQMLMALPLVVMGVDPADPIIPEHWGTESIPGEVARSPEHAAQQRSLRHTIMFGTQWSPTLLHVVIALWKTAVTVPVAVLAFALVRRHAGGNFPAYLLLGLLTAEPNVIAHNAVLALDALGAFATLAAVLAYWNDLNRRTTSSLVLAALATAVALLTKHTAIFLPGIYLLLLFVRRMGWLGIPVPPATARAGLNRLLAFGLLVAAFIWPLTLFEISRPMSMLTQQVSYKNATPLQDVMFAALERPWPAGTYIAGLYHGLLHNTGQIPAFLLGQYYNGGRWYYFPIVTAIKTPIPILLTVLTGLALLAWRWRSIPPLGRVLGVAAATYLAVMMVLDINTGFRHFLPAWLLLMSAAAVGWGTILRPAWRTAAAVLVTLGGAHAAPTAPDYLSYVSLPVAKPHMLLSDSNIYWSQSARQVGEWATRNVPPDQTVYFVPFWENLPPSTGYYLPPHVVVLNRFATPPETGLVMVSAVAESGPYDVTKRWHFLWPATPKATIGRAVFVYDMQELAKQGIQPPGDK